MCADDDASDTEFELRERQRKREQRDITLGMSRAYAPVTKDIERDSFFQTLYSFLPSAILKLPNPRKHRQRYL